MSLCGGSQDAGDGDESNKPAPVESLRPNLHGGESPVGSQKSVSGAGYGGRAEIGWIVCRGTTAKQRGLLPWNIQVVDWAYGTGSV